MASDLQKNFNTTFEENFNSFSIIDTETGKPIDIEAVSDITRLARNSTDKTIINTYEMDAETLSSFLESPDEGLNGCSCVEALGLYTTAYINSRLTAKDPITKKSYNDDPTKLDITPDLEDNLTFKTYLKGGPLLEILIIVKLVKLLIRILNLLKNIKD